MKFYKNLAVVTALVSSLSVNAMNGMFYEINPDNVEDLHAIQDEIDNVVATEEVEQLENEVSMHFMNQDTENFRESARQLMQHGISITSLFFSDIWLDAMEDEENLGIIDFLITSGANVNARDCYGQTALHIATGSKNINILRRLFQCEDLNVNARDDHGVRALHVAAGGDGADIMRLFLADRRVDVTALTEWKGTALHIAAKERKGENVRSILADGRIDINKQTAQGTTALHYAVAKGYPEIVELLLSARGINADIRDNDGFTARNYAHYKGFRNIENMLIAHGAE